MDPNRADAIEKEKSMAQIHILIDPTGQHIQVQPHGFPGPTCHHASAPFLDAFGGTILAQESTADACVHVEGMSSQQHHGTAS